MPKEGSPAAATAAKDSRLQGAFVYTGSGKKQSATATEEQRLCAPKARALQWCLAKNGHNEKWCKAFLQDWKQCFADVQAAEAAKAERLRLATEGGGAAPAGAAKAPAPAAGKR
eukprot:SAG22_NODE_344_length_11914_cov_6.665679_9_plen_114_part_00